MNNSKLKWPYFVALFLMLFGLLTVKQGSAVLFFDSGAREAAGQVVPFVLWFNFIAGFFYVIAAISIALKLKWAKNLAVGIASMTALIFLALGVHIFQDGAYELKTVVAMTLRTSIWTAVAIMLFKIDF